MKIKFLGTGGAFEPHQGNASAIMEHENTKVLIDCGYATLERLLAKDLVKELDYILITHLHADHVGSLPTLLAYSEIILEKELPIIYPTEAHKDQIHQFLEITWEDKRAHYVPISDFPWIGCIDTFGQHVSGKQTFAYYFTDENYIIFYSGDLGNIEIVEAFVSKHKDKAMEIFMDVNKKDKPAHIHYLEAQEKLKDHEVYGYHCDKATMPADLTLPLVEDYPEFNY